MFKSLKINLCKHKFEQWYADSIFGIGQKKMNFDNFLVKNQKKLSKSIDHSNNIP